MTEKVSWDRTEESSWESQLADTARAEATTVVRAFRKEGIEDFLAGKYRPGLDSHERIKQ